MSLIGKLVPFRKSAPAGAKAVRKEAVNGSKNDGPALFCLVNDASGRASFKTHVFPDSRSATEFVTYWFPNEKEVSLTAFWAMTNEPALDESSDITAEPLVMVRDVSREGVVYPFSFGDLEAAHAFLRDEVQHGTDLEAMMLYWAVPVRMAAGPSGKMRLTPTVPPGAVPDEPEAATDEGWAVPAVSRTPVTKRQKSVDGKHAIFAEAPNAYTGVATPDSPGDETSQLTAWMERARRKSSVGKASDRIAARSQDLSSAPERAEVAVAPRPVDQDEPQTPAVVAETPGQDSARAASIEPSQDPSPAETAAEAAAMDEDDVPTAPEQVLPEPVEEPPAMAPEATAQPLTGTATAGEPSTEDALPEKAEVTVGAGVVRIYKNGKDTSTSDYGNGHVAEPARVAAHQNGHSAATAAKVDSNPDPQFAVKEASPAGRKKGKATQREQISLESSRALKVRRWEAKEEPFAGFNSPPGRF